jgi:hypothetical protein
MLDIGPLQIAKDRGGRGWRTCPRPVVRCQNDRSAYDPVTSFTRLKKARLRSVLMPQFTGTV